VVFRTPHSLALVGNTSKPKRVSGADTYDEKAMSGQSALGAPVNSPLRFTDAITAGNPNRPTPDHLVHDFEQPDDCVACCLRGQSLGWGSPVVYFFDRAAWWGGLAGVGATSGTCARQRWLRVWHFSGGPAGLGSPVGDFLERPAVRATVGATSGACAPTVAIGLAASAVCPRWVVSNRGSVS
jgi:hypothetical protein